MHIHNIQAQNRRVRVEESVVIHIFSKLKLKVFTIKEQQENDFIIFRHLGMLKTNFR